MSSQLFTLPGVPQTLETTLHMPYTLTTGQAAGSFLAGLATHRILGSRCSACSRVVVPAQDVCVRCGELTPDLVETPLAGEVSTWTRTEAGVAIKVRLDGTDVDLLHRYLGDEAELSPAVRVTASWADAPTGSINDLAGFVLEGEQTEDPGVRPLGEQVEAITDLPYELDLHYRHAYGPYYGRMFDELASHRRLMGSRCSSCHSVLMPARALCDVCYVSTDVFVDVADTGVLQAFSVIHMSFVGQTREPPYVYAEIILDGTATRLIHNVGGFDISRAAELLHVGMRVRAVWREATEAKGTLNDIDYFEPMAEEA